MELEQFWNEPQNLKFKIILDDETNKEDIMTYNDIMECIERETNEDGGALWRFCDIIGHELTPIGHKNCMGSSGNLILKWENGSIGPLPLTQAFKDIPVETALYADKHNLLKEEGFKRFKRFAKRKKMAERLIKQAKLRSYRESPR